MYFEQIHDKPLPFIETDKFVAFLCASACPSNSDILSRVSAIFQNGISIHSFDSGQDVPTRQGVKVKVVVIF